MCEARMQKRSLDYQKSIEREVIKRKHNEFVIKLRKDKRRDKIIKRRYEESNILEDEVMGSEILYLGTPSNMMLQSFPQLESCTNEVEKLKIYSSILASKSLYDDIILEALETLRISLSLEDKNPRNYFLNCGIIPHIAKYVNMNYSNDVISQALWCLCNIAAGSDEYVRCIYNIIGVDILLELIKIGDKLIVENVAWTLANMIGENYDIGTELISKGYIELLAQVLTNNHQSGCGIAFSLSNLCKQDKSLSLVQTRTILNLFAKLVHLDLYHSLHGILNLIRNDNEKIELLLDTQEIMSVVFENMLGTEPIRENCINIIGVISSGTAKQTDYLLEKNILEIFKELLSISSERSLVFIYWTLSNIAAGTYTQTNLLACHNIVNYALNGLTHSHEQIRRESSFFYKNYLSKVSVEYRTELANTKIFFILAECMKFSNTENLENYLNICYKLLEISILTDVDTRKDFEESGCRKSVEDLFYHMNEKLAYHAKDIINKFFNE